MAQHDHKLDNPAWYSLAETHASFAIGNDELKRYQPHVVAFVAFHHGKEDASDRLDGLVSINEPIFLIGDLPALPPHYIIESVLPCVQMTCVSEIKTTATAAIEKLGEADDEEMVSLINRVQPGYYKPGTRLMGDYYGIRQNGRLVSMTGERMRMNGFTEISAVVTHPGFAGRKYAQQLVAHAANKNLATGIIPYLHVATTNERAINLYEYLGFATRRIINFTKIQRVR